MSFLWANDLVKNTLKTAQRQIDSVLDIHDDDDELEENVHSEEAKSGSDEPVEASEFTEDIPKVEEHETWQWEAPNETAVVVSEPNPVRDSHNHGDVAVYLDSPSSLSPTDESRCAQNSHSEEETHQPHQESLPIIDHFECDIRKIDKHLDEVVTIASSDIEVIPAHDQWSTISSQVHVPSVTGSALDEAAQSLANLTHDRSLADQLVALKSQNELYCRRMEEMSRLNLNLKSTNSSLKQQNKKLVERLASSQQEKKELQQKEVELKELMEEGQKLAALNGKQSVELKRLRQELGQMQIVTKARDTALAELQSAYKKIGTLEKDLSETKERLEVAESTNAKVLLEMSQTQEDTDYAQRQYDELRDAINTLEHELQQAKTENAVLEREKNEILDILETEQRSRKKLQAELVIKSDQAEGLLRDNEAHLTKITRMKENYTELECRLQKLMENERKNVEQVASAHGPLLARINELESQLLMFRTKETELRQKIKEMENSTHNITQMKEAYEAKLRDNYHDINKLTRETEEFKRQIRKISEERMSAYRETIEQMNDHRTQINDLVDDMDNANNHILNLVAELKKQVANNIKQQMKIEELNQDIKRLSDQLAEASALSADYMVRAESASSVKNVAMTPISVEEDPILSRPSLLDYSHAGISSESSAIHSELRNMRSVYQQTMAHVRQLEEEIASKNAELQRVVREKDATINQLKVDYEDLLLEYGARLEKIDELKMDLDDIRGVVSMQAETIAKLNGQL
uniref:TATA element modulatory factor 1 TATA binding domain-containing protein n=1 Tax=Panagrolaimus sp. JU765 TaxID=591449 RepID=A0AC34PUK5_9BILA